MPVLRFETPLSWPEGMPQTPRTQQRADHGFSAMSLTDSIGFLDQELVELSVANATLHLDIEQPTIERLRKKIGSRTGACLQFKFYNRTYIIACDRWQMPEHNVYALHLTLRGIRNAERWGVGSVALLLHGFEAGQRGETAHSAETNPAMQDWMSAFGLGPTATLDDAVAVYHRRAKSAAHDTDSLARVNALMDEARQYFGKKS